MAPSCEPLVELMCLKYRSLWYWKGGGTADGNKLRWVPNTLRA